MSLTKKEKELLSHGSMNKDAIWSIEERTKLKEAKKMGATPITIHDAKIFPKKTYVQIRNKMYNI